MRAVLLVVAIVAGLLVLRAQQDQRAPAVVSGLLEAAEMRLGSRVGGRVAAVKVREGEPVQAGQVIVELSAPDLVARLEETRAQVKVLEAAYRRVLEGFRAEEVAQARSARDAAAAALSEAEAGPREKEIEQARQGVSLAKAEVELAKTSAGRTETMLAKGAVAAAAGDQSRTQLKVAEATLRAREAELALLLEGTRKERVDVARARLAEAQAALDLRAKGYRPEDIAEAAARVEASKKATVTLEEQVKELAIRSPVAGRVDALDLEMGDLVAPGVPVLTVISGDRYWVRGYVPQSYLAVVKPGATLPVTFDAMRGKKVTGRVTFVAAQAEFTPSNVQTPEERGRQVFRFKLDLAPSPDLHPGMTCDVHLEP